MSCLVAILYTLNQSCSNHFSHVFSHLSRHCLISPFSQTCFCFVNPRPVRGGLMQPPHEFFWAGRHTVWRIALKFSIAYGASFAQLLVKKIWSGQVRSRSYDVIRGTTFDKISAKSWVNATWRDAIDWNGDSWWDWCQYMTGCDPWHCAR